MTLPESTLEKLWNDQADQYNQWDSLGFDEKLDWAQICALKQHVNDKGEAKEWTLKKVVGHEITLWYVNHPDFYFDLEVEEGDWSFYFRDKVLHKDVCKELPPIKSRNCDGPSQTLELSCFRCNYCETERYIRQSDTGVSVSCKHPSFEFNREIGDTSWLTPNWCPLK